MEREKLNSRIGFILLSAGWMLQYFVKMAKGDFVGADYNKSIIPLPQFF